MRDQNRREEEKRKREKKRKGKRRRKEEKKRGRVKRYGFLLFLVWIFGFLYGNYEFCMGLCINGTMVGISMVFKPRVLLGFHPNPRFLENRGGKTLNGTR